MKKFICSGMFIASCMLSSCGGPVIEKGEYSSLRKFQTCTLRCNAIITSMGKPLLEMNLVRRPEGVFLVAQGAFKFVAFKNMMRFEVELEDGSKQVMDFNPKYGHYVTSDLQEHRYPFPSYSISYLLTKKQFTDLANAKSVNYILEIQGGEKRGTFGQETMEALSLFLKECPL